MQNNIISDKIGNINNAWHNLKQAKEESTNSASIDPLVSAKIQSLNDFIDEQQKEINKIKATISRPNSSKNDDALSKTEHLEYKSLFADYLRRGSENGIANLEKKSLSLSCSSNELGFSVSSRMSEQISSILSEVSTMRKIAKVDEISTDALELIEDKDNTDAGWSKDAEKIINGDNILNPGRKLILVHELYAQPKVTQRLLDDPRIDVEEWITKKLIDVFAIKEGQAFINGDGDGKPRGILSYQNGKEWGKIQQIISDKKGAITTSSILNLFFSLKEKYSANAKFLMSRSAIQAIRTLKDESSGRYLWAPSMHEDMPNTLLGAEVIESPDMPEVLENNVSLAFGDFKKAYQIVDRPGIKLLRDPYTGKPFVKYYALKKVGGDVMNFDAIKLLRV